MAVASDDVLTTLRTPAQWTALIQREEMRRGRTGEQLAIAVLDLDDLGWVDRRCGPEVAESLVRACARVLISSVRGVDVIARVSKSEFGVLFHATDGPQIEIWAARFETALTDHARTSPEDAFSCAVGISDTNEAGTLLAAQEKARRRMEAIQIVRAARRDRHGRDDEPGPARG